MKHLLTWAQPKDAWRKQGDSMLLPPAPVPGRLIRHSGGTHQWYWQIGQFIRGFHSKEEGIAFLDKLYDLLMEGVESGEIEDDGRGR